MRYLRRWLPVWLRHAELIGHVDLLGEMILAWHGVERECVPARAWDALIAVQRPDGSLPTFASQPQALARDYHSTLIAALAVLQCCHHRPPRASIAPAR